MKRPCACGSYVNADPRYPEAGVVAHRAAEPHRSWSAREYGPPGRVTVGPMTVERLAALLAEAHDRRVGVSDAPPHETGRLPLTPVVAGPSHQHVESARESR